MASYEPGARHSFAELLDHLLRTWSASNPSDPFKTDSRLRKLAKHVERDLMNAVTRDAAAELLGMKPSTFSMWFKRRTGRSYSVWLNEVRVLAAVELLADPKAVLDHVAFQVGYRDLSTFKRNFLRITQMTAGSFRRIVTEFRMVDNAFLEPDG